MPFEIVRNDIINMQVDAVVNTANPKATVGCGVDSGIHKKAGPKLLEARKKIGEIEVGQAAVTPAFDLNAKYVIHTVGPAWQGGHMKEEYYLAQCYRNSLKLAKENGCDSIAFPLLSAGNLGFPNPLALEIAIKEISRFLLENDMQIYLVVFSRDAYALSEKLFHSVASYIDETYIRETTLDEYGVENSEYIREKESRLLRRRNNLILESRASAPAERSKEKMSLEPTESSCFDFASAFSREDDLNSVLGKMDAGFSQTLLQMIDRTGKKDSEIYKKANIDRKLFSKIRNNPDYKPSKATALAFAIALELNIDETKDFISRAGYALSHSSKFDVIVEYFIIHNKYDVFELNGVLFAFDQPLIGA